MAVNNEQILWKWIVTLDFQQMHLFIILPIVQKLDSDWATARVEMRNKDLNNIRCVSASAEVHFDMA